MKRKISFWAICVGLMLNVLPVQADLIWEPEGDDFYTEHREECEYINRTYIANGPDGQVMVYESPLSQEIVDVWEKGKAAYISFAYDDASGVLWGIYDSGDASKSGWVCLEHMARKYDSKTFCEEYQDQLTEETVLVKGNEENKVLFWKYPGARENSEVIIEPEGFELHLTFVDEEGHKWAHVGYYRGMKQYWVCVDAPAAEFETLYPNGAVQRGVLLAGTDITVVEDTIYADETEQVTKDNETNEGVVSGESDKDPNAQKEQTTQEADEEQVSLVAIIIAGVVAITSALLALLKKSFGTKK